MRQINKRNSGKGLLVTEVSRKSAAYMAGVRKGDRLISVNGGKIRDDLDFTFLSSCEEIAFELERGHRRKILHLTRQPGELLGMEFKPIPVKRCRNRCIFCFIDQLPRGLRKSLYVKDEDYRYSFLNGNYITLTTLSENELSRIIRLGLSPLYISVHATDPEIRCAMLRNKNAGPILHRLRMLQNNGISFHTQIVVCPSINDSIVLKKTIRDLLSITEGLLSIAVVPVGLTKYHKNNLQMVSPMQARRICDMVTGMSARDKRQHDVRRLFIADELFIRAGLSIPERDYYEAYPQVENGVGLIRLLLDEWRQVKSELVDNRRNGITGGKNKKYLLLSSVSAYPYLADIIRELRRYFIACDITVEPVENGFFGATVTVAGLLTARDIKRVVRNKGMGMDSVIIPEVVLNYRGYTLDGFSVERLAGVTGKTIVVVKNLAHLVTYVKSDCYDKR